jgi:hypothetical protein
MFLVQKFFGHRSEGYTEKLEQASEEIFKERLINQRRETVVCQGKLRVGQLVRHK